MASRGRIALICAAVAVLTFIIGILVGYFALSREGDHTEDDRRTQSFTDTNIEEFVLEMDPGNIETFHK